MASQSKIKFIAEIVLRKLFNVLSAFVPVKKNRIMMYSYSGEQYSCCPKAISEYLQKHAPDKYEIIWAFRKNAAISKKPENAKIVTYQSLKFLYLYAGSRFIITNIYPYHLLKTKSNQILIDTWHGGGAYKVAGFDIQKQPDKITRTNMQFNCDNISLFLSSSEQFTNYFIRGGMRYKGEVLNSGLPRNDLFFLPLNRLKVVRERVCRKLHIDSKRKICLYAPTWRGKEELERLEFDVSALQKTLEERFGGTWQIISRMHRLTKNKLQGNVIDACNYPDMQELLIAADFLISDYSSAIWDYCLTKKPCFLYVYDMDSYLTKERRMYIPMEKWGFPLFKSFNEILSAIKSFDEADFQLCMKHHYELLGGYDDGTACQQVTAYLKNHT
ncbi:MAG: CDP-glycerol glycerophosphotransferase family protein [Ruminococcus sp.]|nr:CDP-glycerol glycerophosphotransferase family protein [Ruminococcus sp.]